MNLDLTRYERVALTILLDALMVGPAGIEPAPQDFQSHDVTLSSKVRGYTRGDRTPDFLVNSELLYHLSYSVLWME